MTRIRPEPFDHPELFSLISEFYSPILSGKHYGQPSAFAPANLLREARRQKGLPSGEVPPVCVLDPDGDIVRHLRKDGHAKPDPAWACYIIIPTSIAFPAITMISASLGVRSARPSRCSLPSSSLRQAAGS